MNSTTSNTLVEDLHLLHETYQEINLTCIAAFQQMEIFQIILKERMFTPEEQENFTFLSDELIILVKKHDLILKKLSHLGVFPPGDYNHLLFSPHLASLFAILAKEFEQTALRYKETKPSFSLGSKLLKWIKK